MGNKIVWIFTFQNPFSNFLQKNIIQGKDFTYSEESRSDHIEVL